MSLSTVAAREQSILEYFAASDSGDVEGQLSRVSPDVSFRLGNNPAIVGRTEVSKLRSRMRTHVQIVHRVDRIVVDASGRSAAAELSVRYRKADGSTLTVPACAVISFTEAGLIDTYHVYVDQQNFFDGP